MSEPEALEETQHRLAGYGPAAEDVAEQPVARSQPVALYVILGVVLAAGIMGAVLLFASSTPRADWSTYPGSAFRDDAEVLAGDSLEETAANGDAFVEEYKTQLTDRLGLVWSDTAPREIDRDVNGYGGDSLLYTYDSGTWQGSVVLDDPGARAIAEFIFGRLSTEHGGDFLFTANDNYDRDGDPGTIAQFGAALKEDQALWQFYDSGDEVTTLQMSSSIIDLTIPTDPTFTGGYQFTMDPDDPGTVLVTIRAYSYALLAEEDRAEYLELLSPFDGATKPDY
jgi:hypothetical protein